MHESLVFGSQEETVIVPVTVDGKQYELREATADAVVAFRNAQLKCMKLGDGGKPTALEGMASTEFLLVSLCLFDNKNVRVPEATLKKWKYPTVQALFNKAQEISNLQQAEETVADLEAQIAKLQQRIAKLKQQQEETGNLQDSSEATS